MFGKAKLPLAEVVAEKVPDAECSVIVAADTGLLSPPRRSPFQDAGAAAASGTASSIIDAQTTVITPREDIARIISRLRGTVRDHSIVRMPGCLTASRMTSTTDEKRIYFDTAGSRRGSDMAAGVTPWIVSGVCSHLR